MAGATRVMAWPFQVPCRKAQFQRYRGAPAGVGQAAEKTIVRQGESQNDAGRDGSFPLLPHPG